MEAPHPRGSAAFVWADRALFVGDRSETAEHSHHAVEIGLALDDRGLDLAVPGEADLRGVAGALVRAGARHRLAIPGPKVAVLYVDPRSGAGAALHHSLGDASVAALEATGEIAREAFVSLLRDAEVSVERAARACDELVASFGPAPELAPIDRRVRRALARLDAAPEDPPSLTQLAAELGLSPTRLRHLFKAQVGVPVSRYALWMRLRTALVHAMAGATMTEAAHEAGFADAAHFTRTCRQMFGLPPTAFAPVDAFFAAS